MRSKNIILYYTKKLMAFVLSVLVLSLVVFYVSRLAPGDPLYSYYGDRVEKMSDSEREWAESQLGLNKPIHIQYIHWFENAIRGNFGISYKYKIDVVKVIGGRLPNTLILGGIGFVLIFILALGLGILCTWYEDKWPDRLLCKIGTVTSCIPEFWLSIALIFLFSVNLKLLPSSGAYSIGSGDNVIDRISHLTLPLTVVVVSHLWYYAYMIRNKLLEEVRAEYVLLAKSKGLSKKNILFKHCLRNIVPSYLSIMAISVPHILGGTYIVETVFSYPGIGTLSYESARYQDYNLLMALCILSGTLVILCNIVVQIVNERIDPRMKKDESVQVSEVIEVG
ncbi:MAG: ABC transporter permease [Lachnospiraceae bacterium]|nr:ABC transporter permease [Lachnospiraceae bacterium]